MKLHYLFASLLTCLFVFSACGSDEDVPTPDKPGSGGVKSKTMIVNVQEAGTLKNLIEERLPEFDVKDSFDIVDESFKAILLDSIILKGNVNMEDFHYLYSLKQSYNFNLFHSERLWFTEDISESNSKHPPLLDLSEVHIVESTFEGQQYLANHLYPLHMGSPTPIGDGFCTIYPKSIEVIEPNALSSNTQLFDISNLFSEGLQEIKEEAFYTAKALDEKEKFEIIFPSSLKKIGKDAFKGAYCIKKIKTQNNVILGESCFSSSSLESAELNGIDEISSYAFYACNNLTDISMPDVKYIRQSAFSACSNLEIKAEVLKNVVEIDKWAFSGIKTLPDLSLATNLIKIGEKAFADIENGYNDVTIPENVKEIEASAFEYKEGSNLHMRSKIPFDFNYRCDTLYVPKGCKSIYEKRCSKCNS